MTWEVDQTEPQEAKQEEKKVVANTKQVLDEALPAAMAGFGQAIAAMSMKHADTQLIGLQVLTVIELRRIAEALELANRLRAGIAVPIQSISGYKKARSK